MSNLKERAEDLFKIMVDEAPVNFTEGQKPYILELAKRYAEEALKEASERAQIKTVEIFGSEKFLGAPKIIDKQSILNIINEL